MTAERQLFEALERIAREKGKELDPSINADVTVDLAGGDVLTIDLELLRDAQ